MEESPRPDFNYSRNNPCFPVGVASLLRGLHLVIVREVQVPAASGCYYCRFSLRQILSYIQPHHIRHHESTV